MTGERFQMRHPKPCTPPSSPGSFPLSKPESHPLSLVESLSPNAAGSGEKLRSLSYTRPVAPGESDCKMAINEFHGPARCGNVAGTGRPGDSQGACRKPWHAPWALSSHRLLFWGVAHTEQPVLEPREATGKSCWPRGRECSR